MPYPDALLKKIEIWGKHGTRAILRGQAIALFADLQSADKQPKLIHQDIISETPWVKTEDMHDRIIGPIPISEEKKPPLYAERVAKVRKNAGLYATLSIKSEYCIENKIKSLSLVMTTMTLNGTGFKTCL